MEKLHIRKQSYKGYCVGAGVEYPGIIVSATSDEKLTNEFIKALPGHQKVLKRVSDGKKEISVIEVDPNRLAK